MYVATTGGTAVAARSPAAEALAGRNPHSQRSKLPMMPRPLATYDVALPSPTGAPQAHDAVASAAPNAAASAAQAALRAGRWQRCVPELALCRRRSSRSADAELAGAAASASARSSSLSPRLPSVVNAKPSGSASAPSMPRPPRASSTAGSA